MTDLFFCEVFSAHCRITDSLENQWMINSFRIALSEDIIEPVAYPNLACLRIDPGNLAVGIREIEFLLILPPKTFSFGTLFVGKSRHLGISP